MEILENDLTIWNKQNHEQNGVVSSKETSVSFCLLKLAK